MKTVKKGEDISGGRRGMKQRTNDQHIENGTAMVTDMAQNGLPGALQSEKINPQAFLHQHFSMDIVQRKK